MKRFSKLALIRLMMIATLILLTGFAMHWLNMQYKERQSMLFKEIGEAWSDSQKQMIDSMLLKEYIEPAMDTSTKFDFRFEFNTDSIHTMIQGKESTTAGQKKPSLTLPAGKSQIIVKITDSVDVQGIETKSGQSYVTRDLVLQGVKLFVNSHADSSGNRPDLSAAWDLKPDTSQLRNSFVSRLKNIDPHIKIDWVVDSSSDGTGRRQTIKNTRWLPETPVLMQAWKATDW
ncbi:MAG: hypothetical protein IPH20_09915 [Bacteroidales bacterium]|nr:hypothetical protein [Bacteroidales bacterium]